MDPATATIAAQATIAAAMKAADASVLASRTAAFASIAGAVASFGGTAAIILSNRHLERLKFRLSSRQAVLSAKLEYEFEARKRLYADCEPAIFRLLREADNATARIATLARLARDNEIDDWCKDPENRRSTLYKLIVPIATFMQISNVLTLNDLRLAPRIHGIFLVGRHLRDSFGEDETVAKRLTDEVIDYRPEQNSDGAIADPAVFARQGITFEDLESVCSDMVVDGMILSLPAFMRLSQQKTSPLRESVLKIDSLFQNFSPRKRPVLWRIIIYQSYLYKVLSKIEALGSANHSLTELPAFSDEERTELDFPPAASVAAVDQLIKARRKRLSAEMGIA